MDVALPRFPMRAWDYLKLTRYEKLESGVKLGVLIDDAENGVAVNKVVEHSAAAQAGLVQGDLLLKAGDTELQDRFDLLYLLMNLKKGDALPLEVRRGDQSISIETKF